MPTLVISGPTASGKSSLAIATAEHMIRCGRGAEIVNADSMLVYRGMDIGTAKPTPEERGRITHHLIDIMDIGQRASVADFQRLARAAIAEVHARGHVPIVVGGSALYLRAILDDFEFPGTDPVIRARWEAELERLGPAALHAELASRSPQVAAAILPGNGRRIVRALEVIELTGEFTPVLPTWRYLLPGVTQFGLRLERSRMDDLIAVRVYQMWAAGLVAEVRDLAARGLRDTVTASRALGYRQVLAMLDGEISEEEARDQTISETRRFARKQLGWFRRDHRIRWLEAGAPDNVATIVGEVLRGLESDQAT